MASALAKRLQAKMKAEDWSYQELANFLGTTKSQAHDWANDAHEANLSTIRKIAKKLDCTVTELIESKAAS